MQLNIVEQDQKHAQDKDHFAHAEGYKGFLDRPSVDDVKQYIYEHPRCSIHEVAEEMEISVTQIRKWLKEERLTFSEDSDIALNCEKCGKRIAECLGSQDRRR